MTRLLTFASVFLTVLTAQSPPNPPQFADMSPAFRAVTLNSNGKTAWAAGSNGMLYRSTDGGAAWTPVDVPGTGAFLGLYFTFGGTHGWAVGESRIAYTNDGGRSWQEARKIPAGILQNVVFDSAGKHGFAVGDLILESTDGGLTWTKRPIPEAKSTGSANVIAFSPNWKYGLIGFSSGLLETENGGQSWKRAPERLTNIAKVWTDGTEAVAIARPDNQDQPQTYWSRDLKANDWMEVWDTKSGQLREVFRHNVATLVGEHGVFAVRGTRSPKRILEGYYYDVTFAMEDKYGLPYLTASQSGLAVGDAGLVARTEDAGQTWKVVHRWPDMGHLHTIALQSNAERIWTAGERVWVSDDKGLNFHERAVPVVGTPGYANHEVLSINFSSNGRLGWITTMGGAILRTTDGGDHWSAGLIQPATGREIRSVFFSPDGLHGIAAAYDGVLFTNDGGATWTMRSAPSAVNGASLTNEGRTAWAVGVKGRILRSNDGGEKWEEVDSGSEMTMYAVAFRQQGRLGWIWGGGLTNPEYPGGILRTEDGGRSWKIAAIVSNGKVLGITDVWLDASGQFGWAVGNIAGNGAILRTVDSGFTWEQVGPTLPGARNRRTGSNGVLQQAEFHQINYTAIVLTQDATQGWASSSGSVLAAVHQAREPIIQSFAVSPPDFRLDLAAVDPDTPADEVDGIIEVEGDTLPVPSENRRLTFKLSEADQVKWPRGALFANGIYRFHLRLTDGWNIVSRDLKSTAEAAPNSGATPLTAVRLELPELRGLDLATIKVVVDGQPVSTAQVLSRGGDGSVALAPSQAEMQQLPEGFHALAVVRGSDDLVKRIGFYKEQLTLKLFRPFAASYALIIAVGDYPVQSGYSKLPNAVPQARELEKTLRLQGFTVLPPLYDRDATRAAIEAAIRNAPAGPEDRLFVYFGGHGDDEKGFEGKPVGYLVPFDGRKTDLWGTALPLDKIAGEYSSRLRAKHVLFALDSCQSGLAITRGNPLELNADELKKFKALAEIEALSSEPGRTILTAGTGGQDALDLSGGIFTSALLDGLRGKADADHNGVVDYYELFAYVWGRVNAEARQWIRKQQPADYHIGNGRWVFVYQ